ncbi:hypothetical protein ATY29_19235 [Rhizobium hidalgonense]|nr:hypothetical protein ATY29_19235 [Rhizobium hidalgonense]
MLEINSNPASPPRLASSGQRTRRRFTCGRHHEKLSDIDRKCSRYPVKEIDRRVEIAALDAADGRAIDTSIYGKVLLRHLLIGTHFPKIPCKAIASIHGRMATTLKARNPSDISNIFQFRREVCAAGDTE